jgi:hypothetical protein
MAVKSGFQTERRVGVAMDALSPPLKAALKSILQSKEGFVAYSNRPGRDAEAVQVEAHLFDEGLRRHEDHLHRSRRKNRRPGDYAEGDDGSIHDEAGQEGPGLEEAAQ